MFTFANQYSSTVWAMLEWHDSSCSGEGDYMKAGWWKMEPGESKVAFGGDVTDAERFFYYFAHAADGAQWAGAFKEQVPPTAFRWCSHVANTQSRVVGMREVDTRAKDYTLRLVA